MSYLDELTGLPGRRALKEAMLKLSGNYVIAMLDIDFFKKFNDRYGHDVGDEVLKMVAANIKQVHGNGKAYRYGGEEFTILFPGKTVSEALPLLEEVRQIIEKRSFVLRGKNRPKNKPKTVTKNNGQQKKLSITISIGVAEKTNDTRLPQDVLKNADKALYRAKKKGRNCVSK
ncbi:GGDEF domain-containing protein [Alkaliphilus serpentinus]|uniref:GGDEF domain-containing protein n=1 Tax=Alkaliphilus serpentinus TaxID=1482731 RepID=A0A833MDW8_9FIRM|nr:GGDEF domain-containing protein [Alkaliphilus serpentinus]KAB3529819.1 GGDEF domain-containing protein [Alkaliphilus serpentinus]